MTDAKIASWDAYICGPMSGKTDLNRPAFEAVQRYLAAFMGISSVIPHEIEAHEHQGGCPEGYRSNPNAKHAECCYLRGDIAVLTTAVNYMYVLPGWNASNGGRLELMVAAQCGIPTVFVERNKFVDILYSPRKGLVAWPPTREPFAPFAFPRQD